MKLPNCLALLVVLGCQPPQPCPSCDDDDEDVVADSDGEPVPDLPCGGADLQTDNLNCGECSNECDLQFSGTGYQAGDCGGGTCGPNWFGRQYAEPAAMLTCADVCELRSVSCVANGCAELTGFVCGSIGFQRCDVFEGSPADAEIAGPCGEPITWPELDPGLLFDVYCCCE